MAPDNITTLVSLEKCFLCFRIAAKATAPLGSTTSLRYFQEKDIAFITSSSVTAMPPETNSLLMEKVRLPGLCASRASQMDFVLILFFNIFLSLSDRVVSS